MVSSSCGSDPPIQEFFSKRKAELKAKYDAWQKTYKEWQAANPDKAKILDDAVHKVSEGG